MIPVETEREETNAAAFFRRLKKGVENGLSKPLPGILKLSRHTSEEVAPSPRTDVKILIPTPVSSGSKIPSNDDRKISSYKLNQFEKILSADVTNLSNLRKLSWNGVPSTLRPVVWQLLLGYLPVKKDRREEILKRKRREYLDSLPLYLVTNEADRTTQEGELLRQILVDLPRTCPDIPFFHQTPIRKALERMLYIWAIRHPASGYVQGMNDLISPLLPVCLQAYVEEPYKFDVATLSVEILENVEADCYWCFSKLMENIQDHYTFSQPGLQRMMFLLEDLIHRLDNDLYNHFQNEGVQFIQFSFRWMNCALLRELPLKSVLRLWDTYFSEEVGGFENFHVYVCTVLLKMFKETLLTMEFQEIISFLQNLPTSEWGEEEIEPILSQAFILSTMFENSPSHLAR